MPTVSSNRAVGGNGGGYSLAYYSGTTWNAAHRSKIDCVTENYVAPAVRVASNGDAYAYFNHGSVQRLSWDGSNLVAVEITTRSTYTNGDNAELDVNGSTLQCYKNGSADGIGITDSTYSGGAAGIAFYQATPVIDNFVGTGEVGGGGGGSTRRVRRLMTLGVH